MKEKVQDMNNTDQNMSVVSSLRPRFMPTGAEGTAAAAAAAAAGGETVGEGTCSHSWMASRSIVLLLHAKRESGGGSQLYVHT